MKLGFLCIYVRIYTDNIRCSCARWYLLIFVGMLLYLQKRLLCGKLSLCSHS